MASPIQKILNSRKDFVMDRLEKIIPELDMDLFGFRYDLGLVSIKSDDEIMLYAQIVELNEGKTKITIAPGLSNLKERDQSEVPESTIAKVFKHLQFEQGLQK